MPMGHGHGSWSFFGLFVWFLSCVGPLVSRPVPLCENPGGHEARKNGSSAYIEGASREAPFAFQRLLFWNVLPATRALRLNTGVVLSS